LNIEPIECQLTTLNDDKESRQVGKTSVLLCNDNGFALTLFVFVVDRVTEVPYAASSPLRAWPALTGLTLADNHEHTDAINREVELLIGINYLNAILLGPTKKLGFKGPFLQLTPFGWVVAGVHEYLRKTENYNIEACAYSTVLTYKLDKLFERMFAMENDISTSDWTVQYLEAKEILDNGVTYEGGVYTAPLLLRKEKQLPKDTYRLALIRQ
jgi:hypothetical protein